MAIFHCQAKAISRAEGRSATGAAAYRAGVCLKDERTGEVHDYSRKKGVEYSEIVTPDGSKIDRSDLWNRAEEAEKRKDAKVAREWEIALPAELNAVERKILARNFARELASRYGVAADVCVHEPSRDGDERNHHAHILTTTRTFAAGRLGEKTRILDSPKTSGKEVEKMRTTWANIVNRALERAGHITRIDARSLKAQGIDRAPTHHLGPTATAMERRGIRSERGRLNRAARGAQIEREELASLEQQQSGMNAARNSAHQWRQEQARAAAEAQRQADLEREKQVKAASEREIQAKERQGAKELFGRYLRETPGTIGQHGEQLKTMMEKWDKSAPEVKKAMVDEIKAKIEQQRQRSRGPSMGMSR